MRWGLAVGLILGVVVVDAARGQHVLTSPRRNPKVEAVVEAISAERIEASIRTLVGFGTRHTLSDPDHPTRGIGAARKWIVSEFRRYAAESGGRLIVEEDAFEQKPVPRVPKATTIVNVVATLPGVKPAAKDRWVVVSGHYDSIPKPLSDTTLDAPGANDDASGTAAVLELARVMSKHEFDATIVFLAVAGEEQGLLGSTHWAEKARAEKRNITAMLTNDIIGNTLGGNGVRDNRRVRVFSEGVPSNETEGQARLRKSVGGENDSPSRQLARYIRDAAARYLPDFQVSLIFRRDRYGRGGDHIPFNEQGYAAVRFTEPNEDFNRQHEKVETRDGVAYGDVIECVDFGYVAAVTKVNGATLASLALAPAAPVDPRFGTARQAYDTPLKWKAPADDDLGGYRVVWRDTTSPFWTHSREFEPREEVVLKGLSKDDLFFAVQSVDRDGNASLPVIPGPPAPAGR